MIRSAIAARGRDQERETQDDECVSHQTDEREYGDAPVA
jgi:hypothetical protein